MRIRHNAARLIAQTCRGGAALATLAAGTLLQGCSVAVPMASPEKSALWKAEASDITGAIAKPAPVLSRALDAEDVRRANAAMSTALDPQGSGASVNWDNPQTGAKGSFIPVGAAYPLDGKICRAFLADVTVKDATDRLQGAACREKTAEWALTEAKPFKKG